MKNLLLIFCRVWAIATIALLLATWQLWLPSSTFPQVPVYFAEFSNLPPLVDKFCFAAMLTALTTLLFASQNSRMWQRSLIVFIVALVLSICLNQHRFQPWAYQFLLIATVLLTTKPPDAFRLLRWLAVSIYVYSAWSKCDFTFVHNLGQQFLSALTGLVGLKANAWPDWLRIMLVWIFPIAEILVAIGLAVPKFWNWGRKASVALHVALLLTLGPLGLNHQWGVLLWNLFFIAQNLLLFRPEESLSPETAAHPAAQSKPRLTYALVIGAIAWPLVEPWGFCDHWPAWSVYAPRVERTSVFIPRRAESSLPTYFSKYLEPAADNDQWLRVRLDRWSLEQLGVPLYPQNRFQIAVADALVQHLNGTSRYSSVYVVQHSTANRWTGERTSTSISGLAQLEAARQKFWLNSKSKSSLFPYEFKR